MAQAKTILGTKRRVTRAREILNLPKKEARIMVQMLTGHNQLNYQKYKLGLCPTTALAGLRLQTLGSAMLEPEEIKILTARDILDFLRRTKVVSWKQVQRGWHKGRLV